MVMQMKRFFFVLVVFLFGLGIWGAGSFPQTIPVFASSSLNPDAHLFVFDQVNCTSRNIRSFFLGNEMIIYRVYPKNRLAFMDETMQRRLSSFLYRDPEILERDYLAVLEAYGLFDDMERVRQYGVAIEKVEVFMTSEQLEFYRQRFPDVQLSG